MNILKSLCDSLLMSEKELLKFSYTAPHRYKKYTIPKRNSDERRTIAHPSRELKTIQREIVSILEDKLPIHECAYAYKKGISIKDNAQAHIKSNYLLKMDFKDFFPSITPQLLFDATSRINIHFNETDRELLSGLLFWKIRSNSPLRLSIGAPSSPFISNFTIREFDSIIHNECKNRNIIYTRYADDITFSTNTKNILFDIPLFVSNKLKETTKNKIKINSEKTIFTSKRHNRHITGITITNEQTLSIGRERKRRISAMVHKSSLDLLSPNDMQKLQGFLSFAFHIDPEFYNQLVKKYGISAVSKITKKQLTKT